MLLLGSLLLVVSIICAERNYFNKPDPKTWDDARLHCQACYKDLTTITPANAEVLSLNLTSDYWIGLRQNVRGSKFWSQWANGEPVIYQNWYPGHPVPKKKTEPQPTCPIPPATSDTKTEVMQCPDFTKLCACLNSSGDNDLDLQAATMFNTTINSIGTGMMWCPTLAKLCDCLNLSEDNETSITEPTTVFTTSDFVTSPTPTMLASTSSPTITISNDLKPEYIENSCVALLSFGMWQEKQCNEFLPYICYDDRFYGDVEISNVTKSGGFLSWSEAGINISQYRVEINGNATGNVTNGTSYQIEGLDPGKLYRVQVIPVKCARDLNAQNISFYTLPEEIRNLIKLSVGTNTISLSWHASSGTNVSYLVNTEPGNSSTTCCPKNCSITNLQPGQMYTFTVNAVVNETIFGAPGSIHACTKPSKMMSLTSSNNESFTINAKWYSPDSNSLQYSYSIILDNMTSTTIQNGSTTITLSSLTPGTNYTLSVSAREPNCSEEGEAFSITAYTIPMPVSNLELNSTNDSITATWGFPNGRFAWFNVTISTNMSENILFPTIITTNLNYTFASLEAAVLYTVRVITYVKEDLNPSCAVVKSFHTRPNSPGKASVKTLNNTAVNVSWEIPVNSKGAINYLVTYVSEFWGDNGSLSLIGNTSVIIGGLKPGSKYNFCIIVLAGSFKSHPSETTGATGPEIRTLTLTMLCSSSIQLYCMNTTTMQYVLTELDHHIRAKFKENVFWNLTLRDQK